MAAATEDRQGDVQGVLGNILNEQNFKVAASTTIYAFTLVSFEGGYLKPAADVAGQSGAPVFYALTGADNSTGADGEISARCMIRGTAMPEAGAIVQANVGSVAHVLDDSTIATTSVNNRPIGQIVGLNGTRALVQIG